MRKGNLILALLGAALIGCGGSPKPEEPGPVGLRPAVIRVENQSYADFNIFIFRNEQRQRLGRSTANTTANFRIPTELMEGTPRIRVGADPISSHVLGVTREITVQPGDTVFLTIPPA